MKDKIIALLDSKKAEQIEYIDLKGSGYFVDYVIIANVFSSKQALALIDEIKILLKEHNTKVYYEELSDEWSILDLADGLIHLMSPEYRDKYEIEKFLLEFKR
ncbi:ribosome silencing factor [Campylobacter canadensis]|uniref:Ribosome silencing factor n=1 Tax=Campylobacter canadensis TaxID=449520 RepID=A0ABS7WRY5_9BACT|nr:ribosome silencing factor [Campylobacter canadensis]MBZ7987512.1 ribosome silencing factor [Campylobacter canadensis]MBZ7994855.1 ribosome silencing factor [Campylobacter canadensis]MBZ7996361.1 ribosome silencing factor [Campylobacter canadensis]MBZ7998394.1 ribosome silencing factor [Campylobacter canadensis]MBZ8000109.1 ribosome silencing factor [Campylobacter canadensis]